MSSKTINCNMFFKDTYIQNQNRRIRSLNI